MNIPKKGAFTLIEIMVVVFIIGLLVALVGPGIMEKLGRGEIGAAKGRMANLKGDILRYRMDMGRFPSAKEGLAGLAKNVTNSNRWQGPYHPEEVPMDPWSREYIYNSPPVEFKDKYKYFELISYSKDGEATPKEKWLHTGD